VPSVHTGEAWSSNYYWALAALSAIVGFALLVPRRRRSAETK
jgi:LPXTG-motif cell wall-anchored protein